MGTKYELVRRPSTISLVMPSSEKRKWRVGSSKGELMIGVSMTTWLILARPRVSEEPPMKSHPRGGRMKALHLDPAAAHAGLGSIVTGLHVQKQVHAYAESLFQTQGHFSRDSR